MSNNLDLDQVAANQTSKEITINDATGQLDAAITESFAVDFTSGNVSLTNTQFRRAIIFPCDNQPGTTRVLTVPAIKKLFIVQNEHATRQMTVTRGATSIIVPATTTYTFYTDGTTDGLMAPGALITFSGISGGPGSFTGKAKQYTRVNAGETALEYVAAPVDIGSSLPGALTPSLVIRFVAVRAFQLADDFAGSQGFAVTSDATGVAFDVKKNGTTIGTITFGAGSNTATFLTSGSTAESFAAGDRLEVFIPATVGTLTDVSFTFKGTRND